MKQEIILQKVIEIAVKNGFSFKSVNIQYALNSIFLTHSFAKALWGEDKETCIICGSEEFEGKRCGSPMDTEDWVKVCKGCGVEAIDRNEFGIPDGTTMKSWQWHLQQMVIDDDPIKYLEKFINPSHS